MQLYGSQSRQRQVATRSCRQPAERQLLLPGPVLPLPDAQGPLITEVLKEDGTRREGNQARHPGEAPRGPGQGHEGEGQGQGPGQSQGQ